MQRIKSNGIINTPIRECVILSYIFKSKNSNSVGQIFQKKIIETYFQKPATRRFSKIVLKFIENKKSKSKINFLLIEMSSHFLINSKVCYQNRFS